MSVIDEAKFSNDNTADLLTVMKVCFNQSNLTDYRKKWFYSMVKIF